MKLMLSKLPLQKMKSYSYSLLPKPEEERKTGSQASAIPVVSSRKNKYKLGEEIGQGGYSCVYKAHERKSRIPLRYAITAVSVKVCKLKARTSSTLTSSSGDSSTREVEILGSGDEDAGEGKHGSQRVHLEEEVAILKLLGRHRHVITLLEAFEVQMKEEIWIVTDLAVCSLSDVLWLKLLKSPETNPVKSITADVSRAARKTILHDLLKALKYLKANRVVHRDLKPENVLLTSLGSAKLCDFGLAIRIEKGMNSAWITDTRGTPEFMPPELLSGKKEVYVDYGSDVWSFGLLIYAIHTTGKTFVGNGFQKSDWEEYRRGNNEFYFSFVTGAAVELEWIYKAGFAARDSGYHRRYDIGRRFMGDFIEHVKKCIIPYPEYGPGDPIKRDDLLQRATVEELLGISFFSQGSELFRRQSVRHVVKGYLAQDDTSSEPSL